MTARVTRDGELLIGDQPVGWVDRYDPSKRDRKGSTWRGVKSGGRTSPVRFRTRREAIEWVVSS